MKKKTKKRETKAEKALVAAASWTSSNLGGDWRIQHFGEIPRGPLATAKKVLSSLEREVKALRDYIQLLETDNDLLNRVTIMHAALCVIDKYKTVP